MTADIRFLSIPLLPLHQDLARLSFSQAHDPMAFSALGAVRRPPGDDYSSEATSPMTVRDIHVSEITDAVKQLCIEATTRLNDDMIRALESSHSREESPSGKDILVQILENARIAGDECLSLCQDAGMAVVFVELGQEVHLTGGDLTTAINHGVRQGYRDGYLRPSTLDPLTRKPFDDNTPAIIHLAIVPGARRHVARADQGVRRREPEPSRAFSAVSRHRGRQAIRPGHGQESGCQRLPPCHCGGWHWRQS